MAGTLLSKRTCLDRVLAPPPSTAKLDLGAGTSNGKLALQSVAPEQSSSPLTVIVIDTSGSMGLTTAVPALQCMLTWAIGCCLNSSEGMSQR
jgi:hypothetical protein